MKRPFYGWWVVGGSFLLLFCATGTHFYAFPVFFDAMVREMGWTRTEVALAMTMACLVIAATSLLIGVLLRRIGLRPVVIGGSIIAGLGFLLLSTVNELWQFYLYYGLVLSAGMAGLLEVPNLTAVESWFDRDKSTALGIATTGMGMGGLVMAPFAGWLISRYDWQTTFLFMAGIVLIVGIPIGAAVMRTSQGQPTRPESASHAGSRAAYTTLGQALKQRSFWLIATAATLWYGAFAMGLTHQVAFAVDRGIPSVLAAGAVGLLSAFSIPGRLMFGKLGDATDKRYVMMVAAALQLIAFVILLRVISLPVLYIYSCLLGFGIGGLTPILPGILSDHYGRKHFSSIYGAAYLVTTIGFMIGPVYGGWVFDNTGRYYMAFVSAIAVTALAIILIYLSPKAAPRTMQTDSP